MVDWLPDFLDGLFNMISDGNREIRQATEIGSTCVSCPSQCLCGLQLTYETWDDWGVMDDVTVLSDFLKSIKTSSFVELGPMVNILVVRLRHLGCC